MKEVLWWKSARFRAFTTSVLICTSREGKILALEPKLAVGGAEQAVFFLASPRQKWIRDKKLEKAISFDVWTGLQKQLGVIRSPTLG